MLKKIKRLVENVIIDYVVQRRFLGGIVPSADKSNGINDTANSNYSALRYMFSKIYIIKPNDIIVDVGCGKGRVISYLLFKGIRNRIIGAEYNEQIANETRDHTRRFKNVEIRSGDIFSDFPYQANIFYLYNPFDEELIRKFKAYILDISSDSIVSILYYNPSYIDVFHGDDNFSVEIKKIPGNWDVALIRLNRVLIIQ
jgi:SAM-dependent methyltransferase